MYLAFLTLISGILISGVSAYFSIIGLAELFSAAFWSVILMGAVIELGKIVATVWLHSHWKDRTVSIFHKFYLVVAIIISMSITSLGIFGHLSKAHIDQKAPIQTQLIELSNNKNEIDSLKTQLADLQTSLNDINKISGNRNNWNLDTQRNQILKEMSTIRKELSLKSSNVTKNQKETSEVELKLGPVKYLSNLLYGNSENYDKAVQVFIFLIMIVFDPLAIILIISATISFRNKKVILNSKNNFIDIQDTKEISDSPSEQTPTKKPWALQ